MSFQKRFINKKYIICFAAVLLLLLMLGYIMSMKNPFLNASIINAKYYKRDSYKEQIIIDGIVFCDTNENVITVSELKEHGADITGYVEGEFSDGVKINDDIEVTIYKDGNVYLDRIKNVQDHSIYIYGISEKSDYYDLLELYGLFLYDESDNDVIRCGIERDAYYPEISKKILRHEKFSWDNSVEMWNYYDLFGDCIVDVKFENEVISEISLMKLVDL